MRYIIIIIALFMVSCGTAGSVAVIDENENAGIHEAEVPPPGILYPDDMKIIEAKVIYVPFVNKAGRAIEGAGDYFLVYAGQEWFIKFTAGNVLRDDVAKLLDKTAKFGVTEHEGLWDTDNPEVQSRVGKYVAVWKIES